jgi:hypothetical protein
MMEALFKVVLKVRGKNFMATSEKQYKITTLEVYKIYI